MLQRRMPQPTAPAPQPAQPRVRGAGAYPDANEMPEIQGDSAGTQENPVIDAIRTLQLYGSALAQQGNPAAQQFQESFKGVVQAALSASQSTQGAEGSPAAQPPMQTTTEAPAPQPRPMGAPEAPVPQPSPEQGNMAFNPFEPKPEESTPPVNKKKNKPTQILF